MSTHVGLLWVALKRLVRAAEAFEVDQRDASDPRVGLVQPVSVAECKALNCALDAARALLDNIKTAVPAENLRSDIWESEEELDAFLNDLYASRYRNIGAELAYLCASCGGIAYAAADSIDCGTTFTHPDCGGKTVVLLSTPAEYTQVTKTQR